MFTAQIDFHTIQRAVCMFLAACIVSAGLTVGAIGAQSLERQAIVAAASHA